MSAKLVLLSTILSIETGVYECCGAPVDTSWKHMRGSLGTKWMPNIIGEYMSECRPIQVKRTIKANDVIGTSCALFITRSIPQFIRSDDDPESAAEIPKTRRHNPGVITAFVDRGSPRGNGRIESFDGELRNELLCQEISDTVIEANEVSQMWGIRYSSQRPHNSIGCRPRPSEGFYPV